MQEETNLKNLSEGITQIAQGNAGTDSVETNIQNIRNLLPAVKQATVAQKQVDIARILACIPIPPIFIAAPFMLQGATSWLGWLQIVAVVTLLITLFQKNWTFRILDIVFLSVLFIYGIVFAWTFDPLSPAQNSANIGVPELI
jgi:hypothetical protein